MAVTITQLTAFLTVVRRGSVKAAAEELVVTQPSVSAAIASLEREIGVRLTERSGRTLRPTAAGSAYASYAADVLGLLAQGARAARERAGGARRTLSIGAVTIAAEHLAPTLIHAFRKHDPQLELGLVVGNRADILARLGGHDVDIAITGRPPDDGRLHARAFARDDFTLVAAASDPLAKRTRLALEELEQRPWLMREQGSGTRAVCESYLAARGLQPPLMTIGSTGAIKASVRLGLGISLQSRWAVQHELALGLLCALHPHGGLPRGAWYVVRSAVGPVRDEVEAFMRFAESDEARIALRRALDGGGA
ncbi:MAG TPA: LysR family transcriptional regulator [Conexibacter sp.]|nr:LysR family transcriptional regulator [Conexibacter sp.]